MAQTNVENGASNRCRVTELTDAFLLTVLEKSEHQLPLPLKAHLSNKISRTGGETLASKCRICSLNLSEGRRFRLSGRKNKKRYILLECAGCSSLNNKIPLNSLSSENNSTKKTQSTEAEELLTREKTSARIKRKITRSMESSFKEIQEKGKMPHLDQSQRYSFQTPGNKRKRFARVEKLQKLALTSAGERSLNCSLSQFLNSLNK